MNNTATIDDPVIAICINEQYPHCRNAADLYNCTRGIWHVDRKRGEKVVMPLRFTGV